MAGGMQIARLDTVLLIAVVLHITEISHVALPIYSMFMGTYVKICGSLKTFV